MWHSVIIPLYNEESNVRELVDRLLRVLEGAGKSFEIVFVDDGSRDGTCRCVRAVAPATPAVKLIRFARTTVRRRRSKRASASVGALDHPDDGIWQNPPKSSSSSSRRPTRATRSSTACAVKRKDPMHRVVASRLMMWVMRSVLAI